MYKYILSFPKHLNLKASSKNENHLIDFVLVEISLTVIQAIIYKIQMLLIIFGIILCKLFWLKRHLEKRAKGRDYKIFFAIFLSFCLCQINDLI